MPRVKSPAINPPNKQKTQQVIDLHSIKVKH
jgi:hypothetical protein